MKVLVACEESQAVCKAFRAKGHEAYSCDIQECSGGHPEWHIKGDVLEVLEPKWTWDRLYTDYLLPSDEPAIKAVQFETQDKIWHEVDEWDLIIAHPPCTDLAVSGARWFAQKRKNGSQRKSIEFFGKIWTADCENLVVENPVGIISGNYIKKWFPDLCEKYGFPIKPTQTVQPWQHGHGETKATCLFIRSKDGKIKPLTPSNIVEGREQRVWKMAPGPDRAKLRSRTYPGIAAAMADQWGKEEPK